MQGNSRQIDSSQQGPHENLDALVQKHLAQTSRRPAAPHTAAAFGEIRERVQSSPRPLIFDSFCGTGMSSAALALQHPDCLVIGIDKSAHRLGKHQGTDADNYMLVQAECGDFWRLAATAGWTLEKHYLLYPNPWPKPSQVKRRVHGSADFAALLALGGTVELRTNWSVYIEEFARALELAGCEPCVEQFEPEQPLTLFERKFKESGHELWRCICRLGDNRQFNAAEKQAR